MRRSIVVRWWVGCSREQFVGSRCQFVTHSRLQFVASLLVVSLVFDRGSIDRICECCISFQRRSRFTFDSLSCVVQGTWSCPAGSRSKRLEGQITDESDVRFVRGQIAMILRNYQQSCSSGTDRGCLSRDQFSCGILCVVALDVCVDHGCSVAEVHGARYSCHDLHKMRTLVVVPSHAKNRDSSQGSSSLEQLFDLSRCQRSCTSTQ